MGKWLKEMKKIVVLLCLLCLCAGCNKKEEPGADIQQNGDAQKAINDDALWVAQMISETYGREGMFYTEHNRIYFTDAVTGESEIICDNAACTHGREECSAYFDGITYVALNGDKLLLVTGEGAEKAGDMYLYEADVNGTNRKKLANLGNMQSIWQVMFQEDVIIISFFNSYDDNMEPMEENIAGIYVYDLNSNTGEVLWQKQAYNAIASEFVYYKDIVYFYVFYYDITVEELLQHGAQSDFAKERRKAELCSVNRKDKNFSVIQEDAGEGFDICQNKLWFSHNDALWYYDITTGEKGIELNKAVRIETSYGTDVVMFRDGKAYYTYYTYVPGGELIKNGKKDKILPAVIYPEITWALDYDTPTGAGELITWNTDEFISQGEVVSVTEEPIPPENTPSAQITEIPAGILTGEETKEPVEQTGEIQVVTWVVPDLVTEEEMAVKIEALNKKLAADGYPFSLAIKALPWTKYRQQVIPLMESGEVDIVSAGMDMSGGTFGYSQDFIREGYFENLSGLLSTAEGKKLKDWYCEQEWKGVETDGEIYTLPNQYGMKGGSFIAFNKNYVTEKMLQGFNGTPGELDSLLSTVEIPSGVYPVIGDYSAEELVVMSGMTEECGVLFDLETGVAENPFKNKIFRQHMSELNALYKKGYIETFSYTGGDAAKEKALKNNKFIAWLGFGFDAVYEEKKEDVICVNLPFVMKSSLSCTNGISKNSAKKEVALELLTLLYTEEEYANLLLFGEEGKQYQIVNGFVEDLEEKERKSHWEGLVLGIYDAALPLSGDDMTTNRREVKNSHYTSESCRDFVLLGFQPDYSTINNSDIGGAEKVWSNYIHEIWKKADFENAWQNAAKEFETANGELLVEELNKQVKEWMALYR